MNKILSIKAREIIDSRGNPTVESEVMLENGVVGRAAVPSGASTGEHEAVELRDNDKARYMGKGVSKAVRNVNTIIAVALKGMDASAQEKIDAAMIELDGTANKARLGANAILGVSMACARATALSRGVSLYRSLGGESAGVLPVPCLNIINGGAHADNNVDIQEFMIVPAGAKTFSHAMQMACEIYQCLKKLLKDNKLSTAVGDEGGFAPNLNSNEEALAMIVDATAKAGYKPGKDAAIAVDAAATSFYRDGMYYLEGEGKILDAQGLIAYYKDIVGRYPMISLEDGLAEDDWDGWRILTKELGGKIQIVGDDLFVTNPARLRRGIETRSANAVLIKLNQIGTVSETLNTMSIAKAEHYACMCSHRSGETEDSFLADIAVATNCGQIKTGAPCRSERLCKYNQLLRIEEELGEDAQYPGFDAFMP